MKESGTKFFHLRTLCTIALTYLETSKPMRAVSHYYSIREKVNKITNAQVEMKRVCGVK